MANGTLCWRCCFKGCNSWIKTDSGKTTITDSKSNHKHKGQYVSPVLSVSTPRCVSTRPRATASHATATRDAPLQSPAPASPTSPLPQSAPSSPTLLPTPPTPIFPDLLSENASLKEQLAKLQIEREAILNHSIESDQRLLKYTNEVFSTKQYTTDQATQTEHSIADIKEKQEVSIEVCRKCIIYKQETANMISTIRSLEQCIKQFESKSEPYCSPSTSANSPIPLHNSFEALKDDVHGCIEPEFEYVTRKKKKQKNTPIHPKGNKKPKITSTSRPRQKLCNIPFKNITIVGDSHARNLAALTKERISHSTKVTGICKPGAGLLNIAPTSPPPQEHCYVIIAGTNDVAAGRQDIIYKHMEGIIKRCIKTSRVLVSTLPYRHDLPLNSPVHNTVDLVNNIISELCVRYDGVDYLNLTGIPRSYYTTHGLHLRARGKRLVADVIVERLALMKSLPPQPITVERQTKKTPSPVIAPYKTLRHDTFAAAVKIPSRSTQITTPEVYNLQKNSHQRRTDSYSTENHTAFLGSPLQIGRKS